jgi:hypothetical protein
MSSVKCIVIEDDPAFQTIYKTLIKKMPDHLRLLYTLHYSLFEYIKFFR